MDAGRLGTDRGRIHRRSRRPRRPLRVPLDGSEPVDLAAPLDRNVMQGGPGYPGGVPQFTSDGTVVFCAPDRAARSHRSPGGGAPRLGLGGAARSVGGLSVAGGTAAVVLTTATLFGELVTIEVATGAATPLTSHGENVAEVELFPRSSASSRPRTARSSTPARPRSRLRYAFAAPVDIHGGPHNAWTAAPTSGTLYHQVLASRGWTVLLSTRAAATATAPSSSRGARRVGRGGRQDFLEPIDQLVAEGIADPSVSRSRATAMAAT